LPSCSGSHSSSSLHSSCILQHSKCKLIRTSAAASCHNNSRNVRKMVAVTDFIALF
jgi:hypothetical protein